MMKVLLCLIVLLGSTSTEALEDEWKPETSECPQNVSLIDDSEPGGGKMKSLFCSQCSLEDAELHLLYMQNGPNETTLMIKPPDRNSSYKIGLVLISGRSTRWIVMSPYSVYITSILMIPGEEDGSSITLLANQTEVKILPSQLGRGLASLTGSPSLRSVYYLASAVLVNFTTFSSYINKNDDTWDVMLGVCQMLGDDQKGDGKTWETIGMTLEERMMLITMLVPTLGAILVVLIVALTVTIIIIKRKRSGSTERYSINKIWQEGLRSKPDEGKNYRPDPRMSRLPPLPELPPPPTTNEYMMSVDDVVRRNPFMNKNSPSHRWSTSQKEDDDETYSYVTVLEPPEFTRAEHPQPDNDNRGPLPEPPPRVKNGNDTENSIEPCENDAETPTKETSEPRPETPTDLYMNVQGAETWHTRM